MQNPFQNVAHLLGRKIQMILRTLNDHISKPKNRKIQFPFAHSSTFWTKIEYRLVLRGGGICISLTRNDPNTETSSRLKNLQRLGAQPSEKLESATVILRGQRMAWVGEKYTTFQ